jgi:hypothetical protein
MFMVCILFALSLPLDTRPKNGKLNVFGSRNFKLKDVSQKRDFGGPPEGLPSYEELPPADCKFTDCN